jgi:ATP-dependent Clp protease ATP-binding subunit ClpC
MTKKVYRVISRELNQVISIKGFSVSQEKSFYETLRHKIAKGDCTHIEDYKAIIVNKFLVDVDKFFDEAGEEHSMEDILDSVYESIISIFPAYALDFVCADLNSETFLGDEERKILDSIKAQITNKHIQNEYSSVSLSSLEDINNLQEYLEDNIIGQREAITSLIKSLKLMATGLAEHSSFLFVGPTGVGKTQVGKLLGEKFSGNFFKVNCAEYAGGHEYAKLIGSPPGYIGHSDKSLLAEKAEESNSWVFLFDEIEKAHHKLYDFLLSLLDDGTCTDNMGKTLDFSQSIFIFTSNQGVGDINRDPVGFGKAPEVSRDVTEEVILASVKKHFKPEFLNRLDEIVPFSHLTKEQVAEIVRLQLEELPIRITDPLVKFIVSLGYSSEYGARNIARFIKNNISDKIADAILNKQVPKKDGGYYTPRISNGKVMIIDTKKYNTSSV